MSVARRRFRFIKEIAEGGFGKVYLAEQLSADGFSRIVAVKLLHAKWSSHDEVVMRTRDEARLLGLIRHQNIVKVEDLTSIDGKCAIVMEYLEGTDLKWMGQFLKDRNGPFPRAALFEIMLNVASALDAAYNGRPLQGGEPLRVIHRDIKPSNIFVTVAGAVKVLDFGTARANFAQREAKTQALAFGSQGYMAPERLLGEEDSPSGDIFSLGVTLYELLSQESFGRIPPRPNKFQQKTEEQIRTLHLEGEPEWQDQIRETLRLMLSYEASERPTAPQLVDIFELLSSTATDMGLRRFCRTLVAEAKANEPDLETGDPLTGKVVDEDVSSAFGMGGGGEFQPLPQPDPTSDPGAFQAQPQVPPPPGPQPPATPPQPAAAAISPAADVDDATPARSGGGLRLVLGGALFFVLVGVVVVALVGIVGVVWYTQAGGGGAVAPVPAPVPVEPAPEPTPKGPAECTVSGKDDRTDVSRVATVLSVKGDVVEVTVSGGVGFKAEWDGQGTCDLGTIPVGSYRTNVTPKTGSKLRSKTFEVKAGSKCEFTFDTSAGAWSGECK